VWAARLRAASCSASNWRIACSAARFAVDDAWAERLPFGRGAGLTRNAGSRSGRGGRSGRGSWQGPVTFVSKRRLRSLLGLLASHLGSPLSRDSVLEALWPDADPPLAVNSLNQTVFQLRRLLDPSFREGDSPPYVTATSDSVALNPQLVRSDLDEFRRLARRFESASIDPARHAAAEQMLALLSGSYLAEVSYENWAAPMQMAVEMEIRETLLPIALGQAFPETAAIGLRAASALAAMDEFDEVAHTSMARHFVALGRRGKAVEVIQRLVTRLRGELGVDITPEARALIGTLGLANLAILDHSQGEFTSGVD
jgi:DNA-binding SARP family transcriptional activator